jgi:hypothetical protein
MVRSPPSLHNHHHHPPGAGSTHTTTITEPPVVWDEGVRLDVGGGGVGWRARLYVKDYSDDDVYEVYLWERHPPPPPSSSSSSSSVIPDVLHPDLVCFLSDMIRDSICGICSHRRPLVRLPNCRHRNLPTECLLTLMDYAVKVERQAYLLCPSCRKQQPLTALVPVRCLIDRSSNQEFAPYQNSPRWGTGSSRTQRNREEGEWG